ncbi:probable cytochrome P450 313b1 [Bradysia coprophila]|uniref:probable cytochrome P450 313b1 n=1 Tax=Bradysia coprophila TaxID=38358 RepID=UPI00187DD0A4|nr:probable cytochrome P450 313b1 [Bradysia coprophila]
MIVLNIFVAVAFTFLLNYCWKRRYLYLASWNLPGIVSFPLIGGSYVFWNTTDIVSVVSGLLRKLGAPFGFWLGPRFVVYFADADDAEIIINHPCSMDKGGVYKFIAEMIGGPGLFSAGGDYWKMHRRLLNPTVQNTKILNSFYPCMNKTLQILVEKLGKRDPNESFDIYETLEACSFDMFVKNTFGVDLDVQNNEHNHLFQMANEALYVIRQRIFDPIYQIDLFFRFSKLYQMRKRSTDGMRSFIEHVLRKRLAELTSVDRNQNQKKDEYEKRLRIFIDEIIELSIEEKCFSEDEMISESLTMLLAGFETTAVTISNIVLMLAVHQEYQQMVHQEIQETCPNNDDVTSDDLNQLIFTERFIRETMRFIPTVPLTTRIAKSDFYVGKAYVPAGSEIIISQYEMHRDKKIWGDDAETFNPDRFLPERLENQHPYAFIPFSAGARNCIGKKYAQIVLRMFVVWLVRNYKFTTDLKIEDLSLKWMVVMKLNNGYPVRVEKRLVK